MPQKTEQWEEDTAVVSLSRGSPYRTVVETEKLLAAVEAVCAFSTLRILGKDDESPGQEDLDTKPSKQEWGPPNHPDD